MRNFPAKNFLPGIADEILNAKSATIWQSSQINIFSSTKITEPYVFIPSFCEHKKHKTSAAKVNRILSPNPPKVSKPPNKIIKNRRGIQSAASSPNVSLRPNEISPTKQLILEEDINSDFNTIRSKSEANLIESSAKKADDHEDPLLSIQPIEMYDEKMSEKWFLKCVCGVKIGVGNLICCDKCGYWQHCICFNYNSHTSPENYVCVFCGNKRIRCKCGNNLDYNFSIIRCSNCGFYVHRPCEGLNYGPMPTNGNFLCSFCGKSKIKYNLANLPSKNLSTNSLSITDSMYYFDPGRISQINLSIININSSPFKKILFTKFSGKEINAKTFFETVYNKYRSIFFICHPLYSSTTSKKKRNRLLTSFLSAFEYLVYNFYGIMHEKCVDLLDNLILDDLYFKHDFSKVKLDEPDESFEMSENAQLEIPNILNSVLKLSSLPKNQLVRQTKASGLMAMCDLHPDQFVLLVDGFLGDIEEFPYDPKVDSAYYQIAGTRFVLDTTRVPNSPLHTMKRSIYGNCVLKLINVDGAIRCGLFISKNFLTANSNNLSINDLSNPENSESEPKRSFKNSDSTFTGVKTGSVLTLGIDFIPAIIDEKKVSNFLTWHCSNELDDELNNIRLGIVNDNLQEHEKEKEKDKDKDIYYYYNNKGRRDEKDKESSYKHYGNKSKKNAAKNSYSSSVSNSNLSNYQHSSMTSSSSIDSSTPKKKRGRKMKRKNIPIFTEMTLFSLFENEEAGEIMFNITEINDAPQSDSDDAPEEQIEKSVVEGENSNAFTQHRSMNDPVDSMSKLLNDNHQ